MDRLAFAPRRHRLSLAVRVGVVALEIATDLGTVEELIDMGGIVEGRVEAEAQVGKEFEVEPRRQQLAEMLAVAVERGEEGVLASGYEGRHVNGGEPEVGERAAPRRW